MTVVVDNSGGVSFPQDIVLKRGFSESGRFVHLPQEHQSNVDRNSSLRKVVSASCSIPNARWFYQPYVDLLHKLGEIRMYFVNEMYVYAVLTKPSANSGNLGGSSHWDFNIVESFTGLDALR
jgi:hypothetical protein